MKVLGIIAEYNPMHTGHIYHIKKAKELTSCDYVIAIMSGNFTQQGNIAIADKFTRANNAIKNGVDMVIELPSVFAISDAGNFANRAIQILNELNIIDSICFGVENDNISQFDKIATILIDNEKDIWNCIKLEMKKGTSFANSRANVLKEYLNEDELSLINSPNNILGIEYIKNLKLLSSNIKPYLLLRTTNNFNDINLSKEYTSSTSIREFLNKNGDKTKITKYLPKDVYNSLNTSELLFNKDFFDILKYKILTMSLDEIKNINAVTEGLENKIKKELINSYTYDEYISKLKSKRYELSKIKRILINILLNITKDDFNYLNNSHSNYAHILGFNHNKKELLSYLAKNSKIPIITSVNDNIINKLNDRQKKLLSFDILSSNIHSTLNKTILNKDYTNLL